MKGSSTDNSKIYDSGYANTGNGSGNSGNSNRSESSGYFGASPSALGFSFALPRLISKERNEEYKKNESKAPTSLEIGVADAGTRTESGQSKYVEAYNVHESSSDFSSNCKKSEEVAHVGSTDATDPGENNVDSNSTEPDGGVGTKTNPSEDISSNANEGFVVFISLHNGLIIDVTPTLNINLGYTKEEWCGCSFIDFVYPNDISSFNDHLAKNVALLPLRHGHNVLSARQTSVFCCLRKRDDGTSATGNGSDANNSAIPSDRHYFPFHLTMTIKFVRQRMVSEKSPFTLLTIAAQPILHVYKVPEETVVSGIFSTRHDPNCILVDADNNVVQHLGYLPQDMIGRSVFDFYHPEDFPVIKDVYVTVVKMEGSRFRSKPYRFETQNGGYVVLETDWSSFVNPWSEKIEYVSGHHRVLRGPPNPDVLQRIDGRRHSSLNDMNEEVFKGREIIKAEICASLHERIQRADKVGQSESPFGSGDLVTFVENLTREAAPPAVVTKKRAPVDARNCFSTPENATFGPVTPEHECRDSKSSSTPSLTYHELNYNDKIERFFNSQMLQNMSYLSDESNNRASGPCDDVNANSGGPSNDGIGKSSSNCTTRKDAPRNDSAGSGSGNMFGNGTNNHTSHESRGDSDNVAKENTMQRESEKSPTLTETLLRKHTTDMEKLMHKQHKERKSTVGNKNFSKDSRMKNPTDKQGKKDGGQAKKRAIKRRSKRCRDENRSKIAKYNNNEERIDVAAVVTTANVSVNPAMVDCQATVTPDRSNVNPWPLVAAPVTSRPTHSFSAPSHNREVQYLSNCLMLPLMMPIYCVPLPRIREDRTNLAARSVPSRFRPSPYVPYAAASPANDIYQPMVSGPYSVSTMDQRFSASASAAFRRATPESNFRLNHDEKASDLKRPMSQATSVKVERCSSISMSEFSKKLFSPGERFSSCVSIDGGCSSFVPNSKREIATDSHFATSLEDSSDSSFYGNFLNSSTGSSCDPNPSSFQMQETNNVSNTVPALSKAPKTEMVERDGSSDGRSGNDAVDMANELIHRYQMKPKPLREILKADMEALKSFNQPQLVRDQLAQLYSDAGFSGNDAKYLLSDGNRCTDGQTECGSGDSSNIINKSRRPGYDGMMSVIYEKNPLLRSP